MGDRSIVNLEFPMKTLTIRTSAGVLLFREPGYRLTLRMDITLALLRTWFYYEGCTYHSSSHS